MGFRVLGFRGLPRDPKTGIKTYYFVGFGFTGKP